MLDSKLGLYVYSLKKYAEKHVLIYPIFKLDYVSSVLDTFNPFSVLLFYIHMLWDECIIFSTYHKILLLLQFRVYIEYAILIPLAFTV